MNSTIKESDETRAFNAMIEQIYNEQMEKVEAMKLQHLEGKMRRMEFDLAKKWHEAERKEMAPNMDRLKREQQSTKDSSDNEVTEGKATQPLHSQNTTVFPPPPAKSALKKESTQRRNDFLKAMAFFEPAKMEETEKKSVSWAQILVELVEAEAEETASSETDTNSESKEILDPRVEKRDKERKRREEVAMRMEEMKLKVKASKELAELKAKRFREIGKMTP